MHRADGTKVPMMANVTFLENSGPGRGAIPLWRTDAGGGYGNGKADFAWTTLMAVSAALGAMRAMDATGARDPNPLPTPRAGSASSAREVRSISTRPGMA